MPSVPAARHKSEGRQIRGDDTAGTFPHHDADVTQAKIVDRRGAENVCITERTQLIPVPVVGSEARRKLLAP